MALTSSQKMNCVFFLGWPAKTLIVDSTNYNSTVANRLTNLDADSEALVIGILTKLTNLQTKYDASSARMLVKKVGDIELNTDEHMGLGKEFKRQLRDLSNLLDIPLMGKGGVNIGVTV